MKELYSTAGEVGLMSVTSLVLRTTEWHRLERISGGCSEPCPDKLPLSLGVADGSVVLSPSSNS